MIGVAIVPVVTKAVFGNVTPSDNNMISESITTPEAVQTRISTLEFFNGLPSEETVRLFYEHLDFMRGVEVFFNYIPAASIEGLRRGMEELGVTKSN